MIADCPATPVHTGVLRNASPSLSSVPWVYGSPGIAGFVFGVRHGATALELPTNGEWADGQTAKVLWWARKRTNARVVVVRGTSFDGGGTFLEKARAALSGGGYPSLVDIPSEGCWRLDVTLGKLHAHVTVRAVSP
jgi:hypothetical protein